MLIMHLSNQRVQKKVEVFPPYAVKKYHWFAILQLVLSTKDGYIYKNDQDDVSLFNQENIGEKIIDPIIIAKEPFQDVESNIDDLTSYKHCMLL